MESFTIVVLILIIIGITIIFLAFILNKQNNKEDNPSGIELDKTDFFEQKKADLIRTVQDADDAIEQLNTLSKHIFENQEQKYQELLYLYQMIDEKKQELLDVQKESNYLNNNMEVLDKDNSFDIQKVENIASDVSIKIDELEKSKEEISPTATKREQILKLKSEGMSVTQIAKQLNIGQGEVSLVLELKRKGDNFVQ